LEVSDDEDLLLEEAIVVEEIDDVFHFTRNQVLELAIHEFQKEKANTNIPTDTAITHFSLERIHTLEDNLYMFDAKLNSDDITQLASK
jgi:late competence protein required for DNA uptake (superfamily II DNA/RNA helicase)